MHGGGVTGGHKKTCATHTHTHTHTHTQIYIHIYVYNTVHIYIYINIYRKPNILIINNCPVYNKFTIALSGLYIFGSAVCVCVYMRKL